MVDSQPGKGPNISPGRTLEKLLRLPLRPRSRIARLGAIAVAASLAAAAGSILSFAGASRREQFFASLASAKNYGTAPAQGTTFSRESHKDYILGVKSLDAGDFTAAVPLFQRAIELQPDFAMAYLGLGLAYRNLNQYGPAMENLQLAFHLSGQASDKEKVMIAATYHSLETGDLEKARQAYEKWARDYPEDSVPHNNLGVIYGHLGQYYKQHDEFLEALHIKPDSPVVYANLVSVYSNLLRLEEAKAAYERAQARKLESPKLHYYRYGVAFLEGDAAEMARQAAWSAARPGEDDLLLSPQSDTAAFSGHLAKARELTGRASESALHLGEMEAAAGRELNAALREAEFGNAAQARGLAAAALALDGTPGTRILAALALARAGDSEPARKMADELEKQNPLNTTLQCYWLPAIRASLELQRQNPSKAVEFLHIATPCELGEPDPDPGIGGFLYPVFLRGQAYLELRQGSAAAAEFQKFVDDRGVVINGPLGALARLGLARACALESDTAKARTAYQDFFALWKDADPDIPVLVAAKAEYAKLPQSAIETPR